MIGVTPFFLSVVVSHFILLLLPGPAFTSLTSSPTPKQIFTLKDSRGSDQWTGNVLQFQPGVILSNT